MKHEIIILYFYYSIIIDILRIAKATRISFIDFFKKAFDILKFASE